MARVWLGHLWDLPVSLPVFHFYFISAVRLRDLYDPVLTLTLTLTLTLSQLYDYGIFMTQYSTGDHIAVIDPTTGDTLTSSTALEVKNHPYLI